MAKQPNKKPAAPKADPLAGKSDAEKKAVLEAAKAKDEKAKAAADKKTDSTPKAEKANGGHAARHAVRMKAYAEHEARKARGLVVDEKVKAEALVLMRRIADHDEAVRAARLRREDKELALPFDEAHQAVVDARATRAAVKAELSALCSKSPDSVQAAETEVAAGQ